MHWHRGASSFLFQRLPHLVGRLYWPWLGNECTKKFGNSRGILCISFDNDMQIDNETAERVLELLASHKIRVSWAVIGIWVSKYLRLHHRMIELGHELMNHSWSHPDSLELRPGDPRKFSQISFDEMRTEIERNHEFVSKTLSYKMRGFRSPHFSTHVGDIQILSRLEYTYRSDSWALRTHNLGLAYNLNSGIVEMPLIGIPRQPARIFETYRIFRKPDGLYKNETTFYEDFIALIKLVELNKLVASIYLDAQDIVRLSKPGFDRYLKALNDADIDVLPYSEAVQKICSSSAGISA